MVYEQIAAVDIGSNSFRLQIGRVVDDQVYHLDTLKELVRFASGLTPEKTLDEPSQANALATLHRFGERLRGFAPESVRVVATNTLRVAKNAPAFIARAEAALGFPVEVIGGQEEARLIYVGAAHALPPAHYKRLVVDIGGGSTEFIIGREHTPLALESLFMGCVSYSLRYFPDGVVDAQRFAEAEVAAAREVQTIAQHYRNLGWNETVVSSGTARTLCAMLESNRLNPDGAIGITREGLIRLRRIMIKSGSAARLALDGLPVERIPVLPGGVAIMLAVFSTLGIGRAIYSPGALRLGVLYDLLGRYHHHDMRDTTVREFKRRYQVDELQADRVERTALMLLGKLMPIDQPEYEADVRFLRWACALHEIGISIAHGAFHKHGAYIVSNADMPGFSRRDQERLSFLIFWQRGKLDDLPAAASGDRAWSLLLCLRLATLLHRSRDDQSLPEMGFASVGRGWNLHVSGEWLNDNPLSAAALADEALLWQGLGAPLRIRRRAVSEGHESGHE